MRRSLSRLFGSWSLLLLLFVIFAPIAPVAHAAPPAGPSPTVGAPAGASPTVGAPPAGASPTVGAPPAGASPAGGTRSLEDYRHFRTATIDLLGRMPTREEIAAFEKADFDFDKWIDVHLSGPGYVDRLTRIYMDQLRLEPNVNFSIGPAQLSRKAVTGPDGQKIDIYYRVSQRRIPEEIDGTFCFTQQELLVTNPPVTVGPPPKAAPPPPGTGATKPGSPAPTGMSAMTPAPTGMSAMTPMPSRFVPATAKSIPKVLLDERTVLVRPWWLYRDYRDARPVLRYQEGWKLIDPEYRPVKGLLESSDGTPTTEIRVCKEEAQTAEMGHVYASGRTPSTRLAPQPANSRSAPTGAPGASSSAKPAMSVAKPPSSPPPPPPPPQTTPKRTGPFDKPFATQHKGEPIACDTRTALESSVDCGCGKGLERCIPTDGEFGGAAFEFPMHSPLGSSLPLESTRQQASRWFPYWWSRESVRFLNYIFDQDRDFRTVLTGKETLVNGPLAQFYRSVQRGNCCGPEASFGMTEDSEPLFDPKQVPAELMPHDIASWRLVADRGPHAAGIQTMPMFLEKYASARARGAVLYNTFLCKSFVAENVELQPSKENNLMIRPGCSTCHATLEPLAAYFARIEPGNYVFLPASKFPTTNPQCKKSPNGKTLLGPAGCNQLYDIAFADENGASLRSAYGSPKNADATPVGAGQEIVRMPEFAQCAVSRVTSSFLGRPMNSDDDGLMKELTNTFRASGFRMSFLVRGILKSPQYRHANNLSSSSWRRGATKEPLNRGGDLVDPHRGMSITEGAGQ